MVRRLWTGPGRIIVSRPGFTASTALADQNKILDSDWNFSGLVIAKGRITDPGGGDILIPFPSCGYIPAAVVLNRATDGSHAEDEVSSSSPGIVADGDFTYVSPVHGVLSDGLLTLPRNVPDVGNVTYLGVIDYTIFAIGPD